MCLGTFVNLFVDFTRRMVEQHHGGSMGRPRDSQGIEGHCTIFVIVEMLTLLEG